MVGRTTAGFARCMRRNRALVDLDRFPELFRRRVARASELIELGLGSKAVYANCRPGGPWQRLLPGVLLLSNAPPSREQLIQAALRYAGRGSVLTGHDALQLHGIRSARPGGMVHVLIPAHRQVRSADTVAIERTMRLPQATITQGFPVAPLERAVLDAARRMLLLDSVRAIVAESVHRGHIAPQRLLDELTAGSSRGSALVRRVLGEVSDGVRSVAEAHARRLVAGSRLPQPVWNVTLVGADGEPLGAVDAWWDDVALAWEIDSYESQLAHYAAKMKRGAKLTAAGVMVMYTTPSRISKEPKAVADELRQALAHAALRPRPRILAG